MSDKILIRFIYFLHDHLKIGSFRLIYCDTDSIGKILFLILLLIKYVAICLSKTEVPEDNTRRARIKSMFKPILKEDKVESFFNEWSQWFVLTDLVEDLRKPGLLKSMI